MLWPKLKLKRIRFNRFLGAKKILSIRFCVKNQTHDFYIRFGIACRSLNVHLIVIKPDVDNRSGSPFFVLILL